MQVLNEMEQNPEAAPFADEYNKLFEAFYHSYTKQKELEGKKNEMERDIENNNVKLEVAIHITEEDQKTIEKLKKQIQHAWTLTDTAHGREQLAQEIIDNLRKQVENLNAEIEFKNRMNQDGDE